VCLDGKCQEVNNSFSIRRLRVMQFKINAETKCDSSNLAVGREPSQSVFPLSHRKQYLNQEVVFGITED
jgi:hypothetical protein